MRGQAARTFWTLFRARPYTALALLLSALTLPWIATIPLDGTIEGNRLEAAREMLRSGDWLVPKLGGAVYLAKPPLHPWTLALVSWPLGDVFLATGRALSALAALATCVLVFRWGRRELGTRSGAFAALALGSSALFVEKAVRAELELVLTLWTTLALLAFWEASLSNRLLRVWVLRFVSGLALGAAVLVKGPPPLLVFLLAALAVGMSGGSRRRSFFASAGVALALAVACALAWVVPLCARLGLRAAWASFDAQFLERITQAGRTNAEPFWFYFPAVFVALLPASACLPWIGLVRPARTVGDARARARAAFLWGWALLPLLAMSVSEGKETRYLLPTLPAWSLLLAWSWTRARVSSRFVRWRHVLARTLSISTWAAPVVWLVAGGLLYPQAFSFVAASASGALVARGALAWSARERRPALLLGALVLCVGSVKFAWAGTALAKRVREIPVAEVARTLAALLAPEEPWILVGPYRSWWHFNVNRPCVALRDWNELRAVRLGPGPRARYALAPAGAIPAGEKGFEHAGRWVVDGEEYCLVRLWP
ncbi:MAG: hypothetical protein HOP15_00490 [Planctomycetes bacterium]|nr:hypothetical protein [Planctomycetota bacterium]